MASESLKYIIDAEDNASVKMQKVKQQLEASAKSVQKFGGNTKAATELTGSLANALGGTVFGSSAAMFADITGKVTALSGAMAAGGVAAMAFKAAVAGGVVVAVYSVTRAIDDAITGVAAWRKELEASFAEASKSADFIIAKQEKRLALELEIALAARNQAETNREGGIILDGIEEKIAAQKAKLDEVKAAAKATKESFGSGLGFLEDAVKADEAALAVEQKRLDALIKMREATKDKLGLSQQGLREELKTRQAAEKSLQWVEALSAEVNGMMMTEEQKLKLMVEQNTVGAQHQEWATKLLDAKKRYLEQQEKDKQLVEEKKKLEDDELKRQNEKLAATKKLFELNQSTVANLRQQLTLQKDGTVAARAFALEQQGVGSQMAKMFAEFEDQLAGLGNQAKEMSPTSNTASESRLMSGVQTIDQRAIEAKRLTDINLEQKQVMQQMDKKLAAIELALKVPQIIVGT